VASFGENLRRERELRGVSLDEIASSTKVSVRMLQALENDDFEYLPGGIFTRGFIRAYASYLGLNEDHVIGEYILAVQPRDYELNRLTSANRAAPKPKRQLPVVPLLVAGGMLIGGYVLFRYSHRAADVPATLSEPVAAPSVTPPPSTPPQGESASRTPAGTTSSSSPHAANPPTGGSTPARQPSSNTVKPASGPAGPADSAPSAAAVPRPDEGLVLGLTATESVWVSVDADGKTALQRVLRPHEVATLNAKDYFDVTIGNAQAVTLTLNGGTLQPPGHEGEVKKIHLTRDDVKKPAPAN